MLRQIPQLCELSSAQHLEPGWLGAAGKAKWGLESPILTGEGREAAQGVLASQGNSIPMFLHPPAQCAASQQLPEHHQLFISC